MIQNDPNVKSLSAHRVDTMDRAVDAEWNGDEEEAERLFRLVDDIDRRLQAGELYEPAF